MHLNFQIQINVNLQTSFLLRLAIRLLALARLAPWNEAGAWVGQLLLVLANGCEGGVGGAVAVALGIVLGIGAVEGLVLVMW